MEYLDNPRRMSPEALKRSFVARKRRMEEALELMQHQPAGTTLRRVQGLSKTQSLDPLEPSEVEQLLLRRAALDRRAELVNALRANAPALRALAHLAGGTPERALMLYRAAARTGFADAHSTLAKCLDEATPGFQQGIDGLPPQQRRILDHVASAGNSTREGATASALAGAARIPRERVTAQLKQLVEAGYLRAAGARGRQSWYTLSDPLLSVWHQARSGADGSRRVRWLVDFLTRYHEVGEMGRGGEGREARLRRPGAGEPRRGPKELLSLFLLLSAGWVDPAFLRKLIHDGELDEPLFPLARALDYVLTPNDALIERLTPDVRGIVEQLVARLRASRVGQPPPPTPAALSPPPPVAPPASPGPPPARKTRPRGAGRTR